VIAVLLLLLAPQTDYELLREVIRATQPLEAPRGERLPLYLWPAQSLGTTNPIEIEALLRELEARGMAALGNWRPGDIEDALVLARIQKRLGLPISVNATASTYGFFDGSRETAHIDATGKPFFDASFPTDRKMGCPFAIDHRIPEMAGRIRSAVEAYRREGLAIDFLYADWEVDGPLEWNGAWDSSRKCRRCRREIPDIESFDQFQAAIRRKRAAIQKAMLSEPVVDVFPDALVSNYAVYPHDGTRYWYDYFEQERDEKYRKWYPEFEETGFTFAMPVVYPWYRGYKWYDFENSDYRWFYNMLLVGTNAGRSTPASIPIITFVHWHTTEPPRNPDPAVKQLSAEKYKELLWHLLLRGHDGLFLWSPKNEALEESQLVHQVYRESHVYREFLLRGAPVEFSVPDVLGPVVSALKLDKRLLVRRTDFGSETGPVLLRVDGAEVQVPRLDGRCQILEISNGGSR
jgi:hypothetical protein